MLEKYEIYEFSFYLLIFIYLLFLYFYFIFIMNPSLFDCIRISLFLYLAAHHGSSLHHAGSFAVTRTL